MPGSPNSKQDAIGKPKGHPLQISVTAAPRAGRATDRAVRLLTKEFGLAHMDVSKQRRIPSPMRLPAIMVRQGLG